MPLQREVWVTGMGTIAPGANNPKELRGNALAGKHGIVSVNQDYTNITVAGLVQVADPHVYLADYIPDNQKRTKLVNYNSRPALLSVYATHQALEDGELLNAEGVIDENKVDLDKFAMISGTGIGGALHIARAWDTIRDPKRRKSLGSPPILSTLSERTAVAPGIYHGARGPTFAIVAACASGGMAITTVYEKIALGRAVAGIAVGSEACLGDIDRKITTDVEINNKKVRRYLFVNSPITYELFNFGAVTPNSDPNTASRPCDQNKDGFVPAEGAGALLLEDAEHAKARGIKKPYARIAGYGETSDAYHNTMLSGLGAKRALELAASTVDFPKDAVIFVKLHSTGTPGEEASRDEDENEGDIKLLRDADVRETWAVNSALGDKGRLYSWPPKSLIGHTLGAAGVVEVIASLPVFEDNKIPPSLNYDNPIEGTQILGISKQIQIPNGEVTFFVANSFGFGGLNNAVVLEKVRN